jgi:galactokinase
MPAFRAPGRVNLIGDHTDYNDGFVLPLAIDLECVVRVESTDDGTIRLRSRAIKGRLEIPADGSAAPRRVKPSWGRYVAGVARVLGEAGRAPVGVEGVVESSVPAGSGLSSSAALEVAAALALCDAAGFELPLLDLALACQRAEHVATGVPSGIMDQLISLGGRAGHAVLIDCRSLSLEPIPLPEDVAIVVVHSGMARTLAGSQYAERRAACERVAARLGVKALRDAEPAQVADEPRARHVVSENARVLAAARALADGDAETLGRLLRESHASLRDDYEVSTPELDALVEALEAAGALGARLTGAGFGGCVVALAPREGADRIGADAAEAYRARTGLEPRVFRCRAVDGAGPADG